MRFTQRRKLTLPGARDVSTSIVHDFLAGRMFSDVLAPFLVFSGCSYFFLARCCLGMGLWVVCTSSG